MKAFKKGIVDERQEMQALRNAKFVWQAAIILLAVIGLMEIIVLGLSWQYWLPEWFVLMVGCVLNLILDGKQGNLYTSDNANGKRTKVLYIRASVIFGLLVSVANYVRFDTKLWFVILMFIFLTTFIFLLIMAIDYIYRRVSAKRMAELVEKMMDEDAEE